jgi:hypothetical protein
MVPCLSSALQGYYTVLRRAHNLSERVTPTRATLLISEQIVIQLLKTDQTTLQKPSLRLLFTFSRAADMHCMAISCAQRAPVVFGGRLGDAWGTLGERCRETLDQGLAAHRTDWRIFWLTACHSGPSSCVIRNGSTINLREGMGGIKFIETAFKFVDNLLMCLHICRVNIV